MLVWSSVWSEVQIVATAVTKPLLPHLNPDWFYLSGTAAYPGCPEKEAVKLLY